MEDFTDEAGGEELVHLRPNELLALRCLTAHLLPDGPRIGVHGKVVLDHLPWDSRHVRRLPRKHVGVSLEEGDERAFLFGGQVAAYLDGP